MQGLGGLASCTLQGYQNFSNVPVLHYLQAVLFLKNLTFFMNILYSMWPKILPHVKKISAVV
jgi:hypothetical protein